MNEHIFFYRYLSSTSQNEVIDCIGQEIISSIKSDLQECCFYSIIFDTTQDLSKKDQGSLVIRCDSYISYFYARDIH